MAAYLARRLLAAVPLLLGTTVICFLLLHLAPGDPLSGRLDPRLRPADLARARRDLGLDRPLPVRYVKWLTGVLRGDLGTSLRFRRPVAQLVAERLGPTAALALAAEAVALAVGVPLGVLAAVHRGTWADHLASLGALAGLSVPPFLFGLVLLRTFALQGGWLPTGGMVTPGLHLRGAAWLADVLRHMLLPALVLGVMSAGAVMRYMRASLLDVLQQDYVRTARAKGLAERVVLYRHALRGALLPVITLLGLSLPDLAGGAVITETLFQWPGLGRLGYTALLERDYPLQMAFLLLTATLTILGNLLADAGYALADPRVRLE